MPDICTASTNPTGCGHYQVVVDVDGASVALHVSDDEMAEALTPDELLTYVRLSVRRLRSSGVSLGSLAGRITRGEEATNVKAYNILPPGSAITKTNIGTAWTNVLPGANGQRSLVDFTGCTQFRIVVTANLVGTGPFGARIVRDSDGAVLYENDAIALTGERELDTGWLPLPGAAVGLDLVRFQAKSTVAADDPVFRRCVVLVK